METVEKQIQPHFFSVHNLTIAFGGLTAVDNISFEVAKESIFSIIGPNGAGKTTIFNCISGLYTPDSGKIVFKDEEILGLKPHDRHEGNCPYLSEY